MSTALSTATQPTPAAQRPATAPLTPLADAFTWPLKAAHFLEWVNPLWSTEARHARIVQVTQETADCRTLLLRPGRGWRAPRPGQHALVGVTIDGVRHSRAFSLSAAARADGLASLTVKAVRAGGVSEHLVRRARVGDLLSLSLPQGEFVLPRLSPRRALLVTAGSGITPIRAMLQSLEARGQLWDVTHLHYAARPDDVIFGAELDALQRRARGYRLHRFYTRTAQPDAHFSAAQLQALCPDWSQRDTFACGPAPLLDALTTTWGQAGLAERLHMEHFQLQWTPDAPPADVQAGALRFARSDRETPSDGLTPILLLAEQLGLNPAHGCRMGICHGCDATLLSGCVRDLRTNELLNQPGQKVQPCVCAAQGDATLDL